MAAQQQGWLLIGPMTYTIAEVENLTGTDDENRVVNLLGDVDYDQQLIRIEKNMSAERKHATTWHEVLHVALEQAGIDVHDEQVITVLGYAIHGILVNNPWMAQP